jgi:hypothetical protein
MEKCLRILTNQYILATVFVTFQSLMVPWIFLVKKIFLRLTLFVEKELNLTIQQTFE